MNAELLWKKLPVELPKSEYYNNRAGNNAQAGQRKGVVECTDDKTISNFNKLLLEFKKSENSNELFTVFSALVHISSCQRQQTLKKL